MWDSPKKSTTSHSTTKSNSSKLVSPAVSFEEIGVAIALEAVSMVLCVSSVFIDFTKETIFRQLKEIFDEDPMLTFRSMSDRVLAFWENQTTHRNVWWD